MPEPESTTPEAVAAEAAEPRGVERLGIIHLMLWTTGTAFILMFQRLIAEMMAALPFEVSRRQMTDIVYALAGGAAVAAVPLWISLRRRGAAFPRQPGEWLLLCQGGAILLNEVVTLLMLGGITIYTTYTTVTSGSAQWNMYLALAIQALAAFLFLLPLFRLREGRWWRAFFLLQGAMLLMQIPLLLLFQFGYLSIWLVAKFFYLDHLPSLVLLIAVAQDVRRRESRVWTHYAGVGVYCVLEIGIRAVLRLQSYW